MNRIMIVVSIAMGLLMSVAWADGDKSNRTPVKKCGADSVPVGSVCLDIYEVSVWRVPDPTTTNALLVKKIQLGVATRADLTAGRATQLGTIIDDDYAPCAISGQNCANDIFAVSLPSEIPAANITWFQALEACANAGKRLPTSAEWQMGVTGTPDPGPDNGTTDCNTASGGPVSLTGARDGCVSARGAFDMVGNLAEWVADWVPAPTNCVGWASFSDDDMCLAGASTTSNFPGALTRGGAFVSLGGRLAGPFAVHPFSPFHASGFIGFRCAR
ncbi:MAG TPA: SUMF1/EgtB/PvdO family nonheme iron enzyme [Candidatus Polarisedimenticolia bacterium]|nr:SUMF1/EgtB/PvdO family nonheme iron enzyme [Candidatus Polarisedimenticolia bacterium]